MDVIQLLSSSLNMDMNEVAPEFIVPNTPYKLRVLDTLSGREVRIERNNLSLNNNLIYITQQNITRDFTARSSSILQEALKFAPTTTKSNIQSYLIQLQQNGDNIYDNNSGINMVLDAIMNFSKPRVDSEALDVNY